MQVKLKNKYSRILIFENIRFADYSHNRFQFRSNKSREINNNILHTVKK